MKIMKNVERCLSWFFLTFFLYTSSVLNSNLNPRWDDDGFVFLIPNEYFNMKSPKQTSIKSKNLEILIEFKDGKHFMGQYKFNISKTNQLNGIQREEFYGKNFEKNDKKNYGQFEVRIDTTKLFEN